MKSNNFVAKHMNKFNRATVHIDRKKQDLDKEEEICQGLTEYNDNVSEKALNDNPSIHCLKSYAEIDSKDIDFKQCIDL